MENFQTGLLLLGVGMPTVFVVLLIVIYLGKGLIALVNKYAPEEVIVKKQVAAPVGAAVQTGGLSNQETAAVVSAVSMVTGGKGKVTKIEKI